MPRPPRARTATRILLGILMTGLVAGPVPVAAYDSIPAEIEAPDKSGAEESVELAGALGDDGTFLGAPSLAGTVDTSAWTLVSDLAAGEAPRFAPTASAGTSATTAAAATSVGPWSALGSSNVNGTLNNRVEAIAVSGTDLIVGGLFTNVAGDLTADYVAKWNGNAWSGLGSNGLGDGAFTDGVRALAYSGGSLYVGGDFQNVSGILIADYVVKFNGGGWEAVGSNGIFPAINGPIKALASSGSDLYVAGSFTNAAGNGEADYLARWNGSTWSALGSNGAGNGALNSVVTAVAVSGSDLYVGGQFLNAANIVTADYVAKWNGSAWSALGSNGVGDGALSNVVYAFAVSGSDLYVGGDFTNAAVIGAADFVAKWNGSAWSALGSAGAGNGAINNVVYALAVSGSDLYVGGGFTDAAGIPEADHVAKWNGSAWSALGSNGSGDGALTSDVYAFGVSGTDLYVGGLFTNAASLSMADYAATWDGIAWLPVDSDGAGDGALNGNVLAVAVLGSDLYVGGDFTNVAGIPTADYVAKWNGSAWSALGSGGGGDGALNAAVYALAISGGDLYAGGAFQDASGLFFAADYVARWNGSLWQALGSNGAGNGALNNSVHALAISGTDVYVGGRFTNAANIPEADRLARWNGSNWSALGSNGAGDGALTVSVLALAVSGTNLFVGGQFQNAAGIATADAVARWNGSAWFALGSNGAGNGAITGEVYAFAVLADTVYVGGLFQNVAGIAEADNVARWNGVAWSALGSNGAGQGALNTDVASLTLSGNDLYIGGSFFDAAGIATADYLARWNGSAWSALGSNGAGDGALNNVVAALAITGSDLFAGGFFTNAAAIPAADHVAKWALDAASFVSLTPARILDTRIGAGLSGTFSSGVARTFAVTGVGGVPGGAVAVTGNLTVTQQSSPGFVALTPAPNNSPTTSTLNFPLGDNRANGVTVALSATGTLSATYLGEAGTSATTHLIFDVTGYFLPDSAGASYFPLAPARILDSRDGTGLSGTFSSGVARTFSVTGVGGVPAGAVAVTGNLTVTQQSSPGFASLTPLPNNNPATSTLNFPLGDNRANGVTVALSGTGTLSATYLGEAGPSATTHLIFDVTGYFLANAGGALYYSLSPTRLLDTRVGTGLIDVFHSGVARTFQVSIQGGLPAIAVTGNLTVTQQSSPGFVSLTPAPNNNPTTSTLNFPLGDNRANGVTVALSGTHTLSATYVGEAGPSATTHLIFDVTGYFLP